MISHSVIKMAAAVKKNKNWSGEETVFLLKTLQEQNIMAKLDGRKVRNVEIFSDVYTALKEAGFDRSVDQIKSRWKALKASYSNAKRQNSKSGSSPANFAYQKEMEDILGGRPLSDVSHGVDVGFEEEEINVTSK